MQTKIEIEEIPANADYIGYVWVSDQEKPETESLSLKLKDFSNSSNPFIIEGQLYSESEQKSYSIKYVDGKHIVIEYDLNLAPKNEGSFTEKRYIANQITGVSKLKFHQYWEPKPDELCEGMNVLVPSAFVFVGFEYKTDEGGK